MKGDTIKINSVVSSRNKGTFQVHVVCITRRNSRFLLQCNGEDGFMGFVIKLCHASVVYKFNDRKIKRQIYAKQNVSYCYLELISRSCSVISALFKNSFHNK